MNEFQGATWADACVALLVFLNTALIAWGNWQRTRQNRALARKVDAVHADMTDQHSDNGSDAPL